jgi:hypothetical protein
MNELIKKQTFSLEPRSLDEAMQYAKLISDSDLAPKDYKGKPGNVLVAIQMGQELGLKPMQAIQNIAVINGRPSIWGDAMIALISSHPEFVDIKEWTENNVAYCKIKRKNQSEQVRSFSLEQAKKAGLAGKPGPWTQYPDRMLQMRARGFALRDVFADALKGIQMAEEVIDIPSSEYRQLETKEENKIDFDVEFSSCLTLEELKDKFNNLKLSVKKNEFIDMIRSKDLRKQMIISSEKEEEVVELQSVDDWVEEYDNTKK